MLKSKDVYVNKLSVLKDNIKVNCYHIKANDLKKMLGLPIKELDSILLNIDNVPITKYRKLATSYYVLPIELLIADYTLTKTKSVKTKNLTQATK